MLPQYFFWIKNMMNWCWLHYLRTRKIALLLVPIGQTNPNWLIISNRWQQPWIPAVTRDWGLYFAYKTNWLVRNGSELWICIIAKPECIWTAIDHMLRKWLIRNAARIPGIHKKYNWMVANSILIGMFYGSSFLQCRFEWEPQYCTPRYYSQIRIVLRTEDRLRNLRGVGPHPPYLQFFS